MQKKLNTRYVCRLLAVGALILICVVLVHRLQAGRQSNAFRHQADLAEERGEWGRSVGYLRRLLVLQPDDHDAHARLALLLARLARTPDERLQAFLELEKVLRAAPDRDDVRRQDIVLALDSRLKRYAEARAHIEYLLKAHPDEAALYDLQGQYLVAMADYAGAETAFADAVARDPALFVAYTRRAVLLRRHLDRPGDADGVIDSMVEKCPTVAAARLAAAVYWKQSGNSIKFASEVAAARRCDPDDPEVLLASADLTRMQAAVLASCQEFTWSHIVSEAACQVLHRGLDKHLPDAALSLPKTAPPAEREKRAMRRLLVGELIVAASSLEFDLARPDEAEKIATRGVDALPEIPGPRSQLVEILIRRQKWDAAEDQIAALEKAGFPGGVLAYHRGRILAGRARWLDAARVLEHASGEVAPGSSLAQQFFSLLGACYGRVGMLDRRCAAYQRAVPTDPNDQSWYQSSMRLASALAEAGRIPESIRALEGVANRYADALTPLARLLYQEALRRTPDKPRDWRPIENTLRSAPEGLDRDLLRADLLLAQDKAADARAALTRAQEKYADATEPWAALAFLEMRLRQPAKAAGILAAAEAKFGDRVVLRLMRARLVPSGAPAADELKRLAADAEHFPRDERRRLFRGLAESAQAAGAHDLAEQFWVSLAREAPDDLTVHLARFDNAMHANDEARLEQTRDEIVRLDGSDGASARTAQAMFWIWKARQQGDRSGLEKAHDLLVELERERAGVPQIPLAEALIYELQDNHREALRKYRLALDRGESDPQTVRRLVELYYEQKQFAEAADLLRRLPDGADGGEQFQMIAADVALHGRDFAKALQYAARAVPADGQDFRKQIWLGRLRWLAGKLDEAEAPLLRARALAPASPDPWIALVQYYINRGRRQDAEKTIQEAQKVLDKAEASLALAQCYEIAGRADLARNWYDQALTERPNDLRTLKSAANFRLREGELDAARALLERVQKHEGRTDDDARFASRVMNLILASNRDYQTSRRALEALDLLDPQGFPKPLTGNESIEEIRTRAELFAHQRDLRSKREAIRLFEELGARRALLDDDQFLLARLHDAVGDWHRARVLLNSLVRANSDNAPVVAFFALGLIRQPDLDEAEKWVRRSEQLQPDSLLSVELRARLLAARGEVAAARDLILHRANRNGLSLEEVAQLAHLMEDVGAGAAAEPLYKRIAAEAKSPEAVLVLATYYGRQDRLDEALDLCDQAWKNANLEAVGAASISAVYAARAPRPDQIGQAIARLEEALRKKPGSPALLHNVAALRNLQGDYASAIAFYRQVVVRNPKDVLALNNLAFLLAAHQREYASALLEVERAKRAFGPLPTLLDTEAQIYLAKNEPGRAEELLNEVVAQEPSGPRYYHLAQAYLTANKRIEALAAWRQAIKLNLKPADLHPLERPGHQRLLKEFPQ
ncbi:MAG: tetratricopeptide repeat protein [Gemmataceae bacterium]